MEEEFVMDGPLALLTPIAREAEQPLASVAVTVYVPAPKLLWVDVVAPPGDQL